MNDKTMPLSGQAMQAVQGTIENWTTVSFAQDWLRDTVRESKQNSHHNRRKEIVFAVCFVESYLFEIVRDLVLGFNFKETVQYFPPGVHRGIKRRFREVFAQLHQDGKIKNEMNWSESSWSDFCRLVDMRDGLVHASISRPDSTSLPDARPSPTPDDFHRIKTGGPLKTVLTLVYAMHKAMESEVPPWAVDPDVLLRY